MTKRASIVFILCLLALAYVLVDAFFLGSTTTSADVNSADRLSALETMLSALNAQITNKQLTAQEKGTLSIITTQGWQMDPFAPTPLPLSMGLQTLPTQDDDEKDDNELTYGGYLSIGGMIIAFVNGSEYAEGDILKDSSYVVQSISRQQVVLITKKGTNKITLPLEKEE